MGKTDLEQSLARDIESRKLFFQKKISDWGKRNFREFSWRYNRTPYSILISEVLLKRTTASAVNNVFKDFMTLYPSIDRLAEADPEELEGFLSKIGYHKIRSKILISIATHILNYYKGQVPKQKEKLLAIPHIGNYTANSILSFAYNKPAAIVDTNVERILRRVFSKHAPSTTSLKPFQKMADLLLPTKNAANYNYALLDLGGVVCRSGLPKCNLCPINEICDYYSNQ